MCHCQVGYRCARDHSIHEGIASHATAAIVSTWGQRQNDVSSLSVLSVVSAVRVRGSAQCKSNVSVAPFLRSRACQKCALPPFACWPGIRAYSPPANAVRGLYECLSQVGYANVLAAAILSERQTHSILESALSVNATRSRCTRKMAEGLLLLNLAIDHSAKTSTGDSLNFSSLCHRAKDSLHLVAVFYMCHFSRLFIPNCVVVF